MKYNFSVVPKLPTKDQFLAYEKVRSEGKYNMFVDAKDAAKESGLSLDDYRSVMDHYEELVEMYPEVRKDFTAKSTTEIKKEILDSVGLTDKDMSSIKSFKSSGDGYVAIVDCNKVPGFKKGEDAQFKLIVQDKDSHSEKGFDSLKEAQDAEKEVKNFSSNDWYVDYIDEDGKDTKSFISKEMADKFITWNEDRASNHAAEGEKFELIKGPYRIENFGNKLNKYFAHSNKGTRILYIKFDPTTVRLNHLNRFVDTFKMLPIVSDVKLNGYTVELTIPTERSEVGVSEIINNALAKVASNVTYRIEEV